MASFLRSTVSLAVCVVLVLACRAEACSTATDVIGEKPELSSYASAMDKARLVDDLTPGGMLHDLIGNLTFFAPVNAAWDVALNETAVAYNMTADAFEEDLPLLQSLVLSFVAFGDIPATPNSTVVFLDGHVGVFTNSMRVYTDDMGTDGLYDTDNGHIGLTGESYRACHCRVRPASFSRGAVRGSRITSSQRTVRTSRAAAAA